jgi:MarR family transcriptional regulator for hemolysin
MPDSFTSPRFQFGIRFSMLARRWRQALEEHLASAGLSDATWLPLAHLHESGDGITQKALAARLGIDGSSLVRLLDILARQSLIERKADATDARARLVYLTPQGRQRCAHIRQELANGEAKFLADISDSDITQMLGCFEQINQRLTSHSSTETK